MNCNTQKFQLDPAIEKYYSLGKEKERLSTYWLEKDRILRILRKNMSPAPGVVLDVGGAYGIYAFPLAEQGYEVHLIDPISVHLDQSKEYAKNFPSAKLASCSIGDARQINWPDNSVDGVLFFGPLYHLLEQNDRLIALREAYRVLKQGGILFTTAISRFASLMDNMYKGLIYSKLKIVEQGLLTGIHFSENTQLFFYVHRPHELKEELKQSGFKDIAVRGIEGPVWHRGVLDVLQQDTQRWQELLSLLETVETEEAIVGASNHLIATGKK
jgi:ubiquinone/menaquinone biosynthesis C-methylase UbiE